MRFSIYRTSMVKLCAIATTVMAFGALHLAIITASSLPAASQELNDVQYIVNPRLQIERARQIRNAVRHAVGKRLAPGPTGGTLNGTVLQPSGLTVTPSADTDVAMDPKWNAWVDGSYTNIDDDNAVRGFNSDQSSISVAADYRLTDRILLGGLFNFSDSETQNVSVPGRSTTDNYSGGAYIGAVLTDNLVFDASFLYTWTDNFAQDSIPVVSARYDSEAWNLNANLTGYWYFDALRVSPNIGVSYSRGRDDGYVDSAATAFPSVVTRTGTFNFGLTLGYTVALDDTTSAEPYVSIEGEWEFEESTSPPQTTATVPPDNRNFDARVEAGIEFALASNLSLTLRGDVGGLARKRYRTLSGGGQVSIQF